MTLPLLKQTQRQNRKKLQEMKKTSKINLNKKKQPNNYSLHNKLLQMLPHKRLPEDIKKKWKQESLLRNKQDQLFLKNITLNSKNKLLMLWKNREKLMKLRLKTKQKKEQKKRQNKKKKLLRPLLNNKKNKRKQRKIERELRKKKKHLLWPKLQKLKN